MCGSKRAFERDSVRWGELASGRRVRGRLRQGDRPTLRSSDDTDAGESSAEQRTDLEHRRAGFKMSALTGLEWGKRDRHRYPGLATPGFVMSAPHGPCGPEQNVDRRAKDWRPAIRRTMGQRGLRRTSETGGCRPGRALKPARGGFLFSFTRNLGLGSTGAVTGLQTRGPAFGRVGEIHRS